MGSNWGLEKLLTLPHSELSLIESSLQLSTLNSGILIIEFLLKKLLIWLRSVVISLIWESILLLLDNKTKLINNKTIEPMTAVKILIIID